MQNDEVTWTDKEIVKDPNNQMPYVRDRVDLGEYRILAYDIRAWRVCP